MEVITGWVKWILLLLRVGFFLHIKGNFPSSPPSKHPIECLGISDFYSFSGRYHLINIPIASDWARQLGQRNSASSKREVHNLSQR
jgi:hypothetical protein